MGRIISTCFLLILCYERSTARNADYDLSLHLSSGSSEETKEPPLPIFSAHTMNFIFNGSSYPLEETLPNLYDDYSYDEYDPLSPCTFTSIAHEAEKLEGAPVAAVSQHREDILTDLSRKAAYSVGFNNTPQQQTITCDCTGPNYSGLCNICFDTHCTICNVLSEICVPQDRTPPIDVSVCQPNYSFVVVCAKNKCKSEVCKNEKCISGIMNSTSSESVINYLGEVMDASVEKISFPSILIPAKNTTVKVPTQDESSWTEAAQID